MDIFDICWIISFAVWIVFFIAMIISRRVYFDNKMSFVFNVCQIIALIFMWGFLFMGV